MTSKTAGKPGFGPGLHDRVHITLRQQVLFCPPSPPPPGGEICKTKNKGGWSFLTAGKRVCVLFFCSSVVLFNQKSKKTLQFLFFQKHIIYTQYTLSFCVLYPRETFFCLLSATLLLVYTRIKRCARCESLSFFHSCRQEAFKAHFFLISHVDDEFFFCV